MTTSTTPKREQPGASLAFAAHPLLLERLGRLVDLRDLRRRVPASTFFLTSLTGELTLYYPTEWGAACGRHVTASRRLIINNEVTQ